MHVRVIDTIEALDAVRRDWDQAYRSDAHAGPFMSWAWHRGWAQVTPHQWCVLAACEDDQAPSIAFLPLSFRGSSSALRLDHLREVHAAGEPTSDEAGFVCPQDCEDRALPLLASHLFHEMQWDVLRFEEWNDPRLESFLAHAPISFHVLEHQGTPCPCMSLPRSWEQYCRSLSSSTRQSLRRRMRAAERAFAFATHAGAAITDAMIERVLEMARQRTRVSSDPHLHRLSAIMRRCADAGLARLVVVERDSQAIAAVFGLINEKRCSWELYVTSFDESFSEHAPGRVAVALAIRDAIELGLDTFDFLRGEEPYKFQFGGISRHNRTLIIQRPTLRASIERRLTGWRSALRM